MPALTWTPPDRYFQASTCRKFHVVKVYTGGEPRYEAWATRAHPDGPKCLGVNQTSPDAARAICEQQENTDGR